MTITIKRQATLLLKEAAQETLTIGKDVGQYSIESLVSCAYHTVASGYDRITLGYYTGFEKRMFGGKVLCGDPCAIEVKKYNYEDKIIIEGPESLSNDIKRLADKLQEKFPNDNIDITLTGPLHSIPVDFDWHV